MGNHQEVNAETAPMPKSNGKADAWISTEGLQIFNLDSFYNEVEGCGSGGTEKEVAVRWENL